MVALLALIDNKCFGWWRRVIADFNVHIVRYFSMFRYIGLFQFRIKYRPHIR